MILKGRTLLLTGGTGSFGSAFIKHLIETDNLPTNLIVYSRDWLKQKELRESLGNPSWIKWFIGDIRDKERLAKAFINTNNFVDMVIHAAALKDLSSCEDNPTECLQTNIIGTQNIIDTCKNYGVDKFILISTDKAVLPINIYGTSKKMAEKLWISAGGNVARYGNVIGSSGSVLPVFRKMISDGATSLPITDDRCTRYWFNMKDAIQLVLDAIRYSSSGITFIPKMPSIRIIDLCKALDMPYHIVGLRSGEKIHEDLIPPDEITGSIGYNSGNNSNFLTISEIKESIYGV